jgi:rare lipoprotein A
MIATSRAPLIFTALLLVFSFLFLGSCSQSRYVAHVVKQIPMPNDTPNKIGHFKIGKPYTIKGERYFPKESYTLTETGVASWYGPGFHGKLTANGEIFNENDLTAAHRTLQLPSIIRVTNMENGRSLVLRVNDRGPFAHDRILDVSDRAASLLGFKNKGTAQIKVQVMENESREVARMAKAKQDTRGYEIALNQHRPAVIQSIPLATELYDIEPAASTSHYAH